MERYEQYARVFNRFDSDRDGKICPAELRQCVASISSEMTAEEAEAAVVLMDSDGDGLLCPDEGPFEMYAPNGSGGGCITPENLRRMLSRLGERRSVDDCRNMIARFDLNGDGVLNFDEFKIMMTCS